MLARRGRFSIKPNLAKGAQRSKPVEEKQKTPDPEEESPSPPGTNEQPAVVATTTAPVVDMPPPPAARAPSPMSSLMRDPAILTPATQPEAHFAVPEPKKPELLMERAVSPALSECSMTSEARRNERRMFTGTEELDTKSMRIMDMIYWNPKNGHSISKKKASDVMSVDSPTKPPVDSKPRTLAPQVKIGPDGQLILDESSLVVANTGGNDTSIWETVDDDRLGRKVTSLSFRNRLWRKGTLWTEKENELFYEILRCTGPDFGLMHEYFPSRARCELKSKYNREERSNWAKVNEVLSMPRLLDDTLFDRVERLQRAIQEEADAKLLAKKNKGKRARASPSPAPSQTVAVLPVATIDWDEEKADLVGEAEELIRKLEKKAAKEREQKRDEEAMHFLANDWTSSSSGEDEEWKEEKKKIKKRKLNDARKLTGEARKQARASARVAAKPKKVYAGYEEVDDPEEEEEEQASGVVEIKESESSTKTDGSTTNKVAKPAISSKEPAKEKSAEETTVTQQPGTSAEKGPSTREEADLVLSTTTTSTTVTKESPKKTPRPLSRLKKPPPAVAITKKST